MSLRASINAQQIRERYLKLLARVESQIGAIIESVPSPESAEEVKYDPMHGIANELRTGGPGNTVNFLKNTDFFVGIERDDPNGQEKFLAQLASQSEVSLNELDYVLTGLERATDEIEAKHRA